MIFFSQARIQGSLEVQFPPLPSKKKCYMKSFLTYILYILVCYLYLLWFNNPSYSGTFEYNCTFLLDNYLLSINST